MKRIVVTLSLVLAAGCRDNSGRAPAPAPADPAPGLIEARGGVLATAKDGGPGPIAAALALGIAHAHERPVDHVGRARELARAADEAGAAVELRRALFDRPDDSEALRLYGRMARHGGDAAAAITSYQRLKSLDPTDALPCLRLARLRLERREMALARAEAEEAVRRDAGAAESHHVLGRVELEDGRLEPAIAAFEQAAALDPGHAWALNNLGYAYLLANRSEKAAEILEEAVRAESGEAVIWNNLGLAYERIGESGLARHAYAKALELRPKYVKARINAARSARVAEAPPPVTDVPVKDGVDADAAATGAAGEAAHGEADLSGPGGHR